jgi:hypothetical protein
MRAETKDSHIYVYVIHTYVPFYQFLMTSMTIGLSGHTNKQSFHLKKQSQACKNSSLQVEHLIGEIAFFFDYVSYHLATNAKWADE